MIGRFFCSLLLLTACAEPKYVRKDGPQKSTLAQQKADFPSGQAVWLAWEKFPTDQDFGSFVIKLGRMNKADQTAIPEDWDGVVEVELFMPAMGHGSSPVSVQRVDTGTYRATEVFFTMPGDWEIRIQRKKNGSLVEQAIFPIRI